MPTAPYITVLGVSPARLPSESCGDTNKKRDGAMAANRGHLSRPLGRRLVIFSGWPSSVVGRILDGIASQLFQEDQCSQSAIDGSVK
jgi:hypothetical protein